MAYYITASILTSLVNDILSSMSYGSGRCVTFITNVDGIHTGKLLQIIYQSLSKVGKLEWICVTAWCSGVLCV
jgi:hypothetical protein